MKIDAATFRLVVGGLVLALLFDLAGLLACALIGTDAPGEFSDLLQALVPSLLALLVSSHSEDPVPVTVTDQPVTVTDAPSGRLSTRKSKS